MSLKIFLLGLLERTLALRQGIHSLSDCRTTCLTLSWHQWALAVSLRPNNQEHLMRDVIFTRLILGKRHGSVLIVRNMNSDASGFDIATHVVSISAW